MKCFYIHCGLHKTGTTSLQHALSEGAANLLKHGILYPNIGVPSNHAGQHNLAWQMNRYRRFDPRFGDWDTLFSTLVKFNSSVVISSEDFESTLLKPFYWQEIVNKLYQLGFQVVFVIYLRSPITYLESIYLEHLKSGNGAEFLSVFNMVCDLKKLCYDEREFCFNYANIQKAMSSLPKARLVFRDYDNFVNDSIVDDFENVLGVHGALSQSVLNNNKKNLRPPVQKSLKLFVRNRTWSWFEQRSPHKIYSIVDTLMADREFRLATPLGMRSVLDEKLIETNTFLASLNLDKCAKNKAISAEVKQLNIQRLFSFETYLLLLGLARSLDGYELSNEISAFNSKTQAQINSWWDWIAFDESA